MERQLSVRQMTDEKDLELMTDWMFRWWGERERHSREEVRVFMASCRQKDRLPQTYGLYFGEEPVGLYQFTYGDLFSRPDIYPWLANVYVDGKYRGRGFGRYLLSTVKENAAAHLHAEEIFLYTDHVGLYEKFGWEFAEEVDSFADPRIQRIYRLRIAASWALVTGSFAP